VSTPNRSSSNRVGTSSAAVSPRSSPSTPLAAPAESAALYYYHVSIPKRAITPGLICNSAVVSTGFALQQYYSPKDKNNRLLRCSYAVVDEYSRKFMAVRLNPLKKFKPSVCLSFEPTSLEIKDHVPMLKELRGIKRRL
ncbi:hypothetical protein CBL_21358, partial [Carabus blaptoides fortunei]